MATRINEDIYRDMVESGEIQLSDILPQDYGYVGNIEEDSEFNTPYTTRNRTGILSAYDRLMGPIKRTYQNYGAPLMGTLFGALTGIPGIGFLMRNLPTDPYAQNYKTLADGAYMSSTGLKDKFGYNIGPTLFQNNFLQPGSNSYRSYALQALNNLNKNAAEKYYQETYGIKPTGDMSAFDIVKKDIQKKKDPFGSAEVLDLGSDYQGDVGPSGGKTQGSNIEGSVSRGGTDDTPGTPFKKGGLTSL